MKREDLNDALGWTVSRETYDRLVIYHDILLRWSETHNLIGPKERNQLWERHILDSLQLWPHVKFANHILDFGSGAGLPGLVLACCAHDERGKRLHLVESNGKRCAFLSHVSRRLSLPVEIQHARVENVSCETIDIVTARAVADLNELLTYSQKWLLNGAKAVFPKGKSWEDELTQARRYWSFKVQVFPSKSDSLGVVLFISEVSANNG